MKFRIVFAIIYFFLTCAFSQQGDSVYNSLNLSYQFEAAKKYSLAIDTMTKTEFPQEFNYLKYARLGWLSYLDNKFNEAISFYQKADQLEPGSIEVKEAMLKNYFLVQEYSKTERTARRILKIYPLNYSARYSLAELAVLNLDFAEAEFQLKKIIKTFPTDFAANKLLLQCYKSQNNKNKAAKIENFLHRFYQFRDEKK